MVPPPRHKMPGPHAEPVPGRYQGGGFPPCPVCESAPFSCPISPEPAAKRQFPALSMGKLAPFPTPSAPNWRQSGSFPLCPWVNLGPCSAPSAPNRRQSGNFPLCPVGESAPFPPPSSARNWHQGGSFPPCPVGESAPFPHTVCPGTGVRTAVFLSARCVNQPPCSTPSVPDLASRRQFSALPGV